jgi:predicted TIM-barrel fold metal-dependent hydrolase
MTKAEASGHPRSEALEFPKEIFDVHVHIGSDANDREFLAFAKERNVRFAASCLGADGPMLANPTADQCRAANDKLIAYVASNPGLAYGFCYVNPLEPGAADEVRRCAGCGMVGVKLWIACPCTDPRVYPIAEAAIDLNVPILQHCYVRIENNLEGESTPPDVAALSRRYPELKLIMAHMALNWRYGVDCVADCPNVAVDTSGFDPESGSIEYAVSRLGAERVLFGTDAPGRDFLGQLGKAVAADIPTRARELILHANADRLLSGAR